jgi:two-component system, cell cycle sensor histidine kinase and response regulator CckA
VMKLIAEKRRSGVKTNMNLLLDQAIESRSLTRRLSVSLIIAVLIVSVIAITAMRHIVSRTTMRGLEQKAEETLAYLAGTLETPLWEVDDDEVKSIGEVVSHDESIARLVIRNESGAVIYSNDKETSGDLISRSGKIIHIQGNQEKYLGDVSVSLTPLLYNESSRQLLFFSILIIFLILISVVIVTFFFIRTSLNKPLKNLNEITDLFASGVYNISGHTLPYQEFQPFGRALTDMAEKIEGQIRMVQEAEAKYRDIFENAVEGIFQTTIEGRFRNINPALSRILGYDSQEELIEGVRDRINNLYLNQEERDKLLSLLFERGAVTGYEVQLRRKDEEVIWVSISARIVLDETGSPFFIEGFLTDISSHKRAERALEESEAKMGSILNNIGIGVALISPRMEILELNHQMRIWFPSVDPAQHPICYRALIDPLREMICDYCPVCKTLKDGLVHETMTETPRKGVIRNYRIVSTPILNAAGEVTAAIEMVEDITERLSLEARFQQAQKMESVGRLAGGVAHDFNNMLGVIIGHTELVLRQVDSTQPFFSNLQEVRKAAQRSADLTRQLLAFARKQTIAPKVLDLNETVESMLKMLRHLIGEDINLAWLPSKNLWPVNMDPSQIDQILANLCVNARDAIAGVGKVTIETGTSVFDEVYCANHAECVPGEYMLLSVSDDGCGMNKEILDKLFEPFFTTKELGKGTGLGLATVYGIVKQNNGFINVSSEPGKGTTFTICLPRFKGNREQMRKEGSGEPARGDETILLVEDDQATLGMTTLMLQRFGYTILAASAPGEAIRIAKEHTGKIHLLVTDVVMPDMNGRDLAENLLSQSPHFKCLFMSGYTSDVIGHHGMLGEGVNFIQKPFSLQALATKVREVLDS